MSGILKKTTGLTGLAVRANPHKHLTVLYSKVLAVIGKMPDGAVYKTSTESIIKDRLAIVNTEPTVPGLERKMNCGQAEELIIQAENELKLARNMLKWKPWEPLIEEPPKNQWKWPI